MLRRENTVIPDTFTHFVHFEIIGAWKFCQFHRKESYCAFVKLRIPEYTVRSNSANSDTSVGHGVGYINYTRAHFGQQRRHPCVYMHLHWS